MTAPVTYTKAQMLERAGKLDRQCKWCYGNVKPDDQCAEEPCHVTAAMLRQAAAEGQGEMLNAGFARARGEATPTEPTQVEDNRLRCLDCRLPYADFPLDMVIPDAQWALIHNSGGGVLCAQCIVTRLSRIKGVTVVLAHADIPSGDVIEPTPPPAVGRCKTCQHWDTGRLQVEGVLNGAVYSLCRNDAGGMDAVPADGSGFCHLHEAAK